MLFLEECVAAVFANRDYAEKNCSVFSVLITDHCLYLALIINGSAISSIPTVERNKKN